MKRHAESRTPPFGPGERTLLETGGAELFRLAVSFGSLDADDQRFAEGGPDYAAVQLLLSIGLLRIDDESGRYLPVDPAAAHAQIVTPLSQVGNELLNESSLWAGTFTTLGQAFRSGSLSTASAITEIHDYEKINVWIDAALADCREELLTAQPHGKRPASALAEANQRDIDALARGVKMRTLYQHSARQSPGTREYVKTVTDHGAEVRTLDEFFNRLIVFDRKLALIPGSADHAVAVAIHSPSIVAYLVDVFDRAWERAMPFDASGEDVRRSIAEDVRAMTLRMLTEGHSDASSAKRMGISARTYASYIATLKDEFGVQTRFQLGLVLGKALGPTVEEPPSTSLEP
jgi:sugar-specific transcriptional regulator TrmB